MKLTVTTILSCWLAPRDCGLVNEPLMSLHALMAGGQAGLPGALGTHPGQHLLQPHRGLHVREMRGPPVRTVCFA